MLIAKSSCMGKKSLISGHTDRLKALINQYTYHMITLLLWHHSPSPLSAAAFMVRDIDWTHVFWTPFNIIWLNEAISGPDHGWLTYKVTTVLYWVKIWVYFSHWDAKKPKAQIWFEPLLAFLSRASFVSAHQLTIIAFDSFIYRKSSWRGIQVTPPFVKSTRYIFCLNELGMLKGEHGEWERERERERKPQSSDVGARLPGTMRSHALQPIILVIQ